MEQREGRIWGSGVAFPISQWQPAPPPGWDLASRRGEREESALRIRAWSTATNTARSSANVVDRLYRERQRFSPASVGMSAHPSTHTALCLWMCVSRFFFLFISFPHNFSGVWCCTMLSEQRCSIIRKRQHHFLWSDCRWSLCTKARLSQTQTAFSHKFKSTLMWHVAALVPVFTLCLSIWIQ